MAAAGRFKMQPLSLMRQGTLQVTQILLDVARPASEKPGQLRHRIGAPAQAVNQILPEHELLSRAFDSFRQTPYRNGFCKPITMADSKPGFEEQLKELEQIVTRLEQGDVSLEESLKLFEKGVHLARACQAALEEAEQKVQILTRNDDGSLRCQPLKTDD